MQYDIFSVRRLISKKGFMGALHFLADDDSSKEAGIFSKANLSKLISIAGIQGALVFLGDSNFPETMKKELAKEHYFVGGYPNVELISTLM